MIEIQENQSIRTGLAKVIIQDIAKNYSSSDTSIEEFKNKLEKTIKENLNFNINIGKIESVDPNNLSGSMTMVDENGVLRNVNFNIVTNTSHTEF